jgi:hypothetical protein
MPYIRVSKEVHDALMKLKGWLQMRTGKEVSVDEALRYVLAIVELPIDVYVEVGELEKLLAKLKEEKS